MDGILGGVDACQGDSGGPLWVEWDGRATQVFVVSSGRGSFSDDVLLKIHSQLFDKIAFMPV